MSWFSKLRGTIESVFQLGLGGPQLKNNSAVIECRNSDDSGFAIMRTNNPVNSHDAVTQLYMSNAVAADENFALILDDNFSLVTTDL